MNCPLKMKKIFFFVVSLLILSLSMSLSSSRVYASGNEDFIFTVHVDGNINDKYTIPINGNYSSLYNYNVDCNNDGTFEATGLDGNSTYDCVYSSDGDYTIRIEDNSGNKTGYPAVFFGGSGDTASKEALLEVKQWGSMKWQDMSYAFSGCSNFTLTATDVPDLSDVTDMKYAFAYTSQFNNNINNWDVSNVTNMSYMFFHATAFNQPLNNWNVSNVTDMSYMFFQAAAFNQPLNNWNVSNVINMSSMFFQATAFNQSLNGWSFASQANLSAMFYGATSFNQDLSSWDVKRVKNMAYMFYGATAFNQDLSAWNVRNVTDMSSMFDTSGLSTRNYDKILIAWDSLSVLQNNVTLGAASTHYCNSADARQDLISNHNWTINDAGQNCSINDFVIKIHTDSNNQFKIPTDPNYTYNYNIDCDDDGTLEATGVTGDYTCSYPDAGVYTIRIKDNTGNLTGFPHIYFYNASQETRDNLGPVIQWGNMKWQSMAKAFYFCRSMTVQDSNAPDLSNVTDVSYMFYNAYSLQGTNLNNWDTSNVHNMAHMFDHAYSFNGDIGSWNTENVTDMSYVFAYCHNFNQDLSHWNTSNVINMAHMFEETGFNKDVSNWDVGNVADMSYMFCGDHVFNQNLLLWNTSNVTNMAHMFDGASSFNKPLNSWNVSKVTNMAYMFNNTFSFDQELNSWDVSSVTDMQWMFANSSSFNKPLNNWNVSNVTNMQGMFDSSHRFDQDISSWNISNVTDMSNMFDDSNLSRVNYDNILIGWDSLSSIQNSVNLGASNIHYCNGEAARSDLISTHGWVISDAGKDCSLMTISGVLTASLSPDSVDTQTVMTLHYILPSNLLANANISIMYDPAFGGGDALTNDDISVTSTKGNIGTCTASNFSNGYFDLTCAGSATNGEVLTITIGNTHKLTNPAQPGNYDPSIVIDNNGNTTMNGATLAYVGDKNDVNVTAYVPAVLDLDIYEAGSNIETNSCNLGVLSVNKVNSCSYDISAGTNNSTGLTIKMRGVLTSDWSTGSSNLTNSDGIHTINAVTDGTVTAGYNEYGFKITDNGSNSFTAANGYDTQDSPVPSAEAIIATTSTTIDGTNDSNKRLEITHYASMSNDTVSGNYSQGIVWTAYTN